MMRMLLVLGALGAAVGLAGCNETAGAGPVVSAPPPPVAMSLPAGTACANEINRYQSILKSDLSTGNVEQSVYDQIQHEMARAAAACSAGKGAEAHSLVTASKARHGYRA